MPCSTPIRLTSSTQRQSSSKMSSMPLPPATPALLQTTWTFLNASNDAAAALARFIAPKGSVALDGVSLTVNEVDEDCFSVLIIPHTLKVTTFGALRVAARLNLELDLMARYAARLLQAPRSSASR